MAMQAPHHAETEKECRLTSELESIAGAARQVMVYCRPYLPADRQSEAIAAAIELCVTEVLTNVIRHAYGGAGGRPIQLQVKAEPGLLEVHVYDEGAKMPAGTIRSSEVDFDPTDISALPEGGFGWPLINCQMDQVRYRREGNRNHLTLIKAV